MQNKDMESAYRTIEKEIEALYDERRTFSEYYVNTNEEYIVMMSEAWLLATIAISFPNDIYEFLCDTNDNTLKRKTISKMVDSFRIDDETKEKFKKLRR